MNYPLPGRVSLWPTLSPEFCLLQKRMKKYSPKTISEIKLKWISDKLEKCKNKLGQWARINRMKHNQNMHSIWVSTIKGTILWQVASPP